MSSTVSKQDRHTLLAVRTNKIVQGRSEAGTYLSVLRPTTRQLAAMYQAATSSAHLDEEVPGTVFKVQTRSASGSTPFQDSHPRLSQLLALLSQPGQYHKGRNGQMITRTLLDQLVVAAEDVKDRPKEYLEPIDERTFQGVDDVDYRLKMAPRPQWDESMKPEFQLGFLYAHQLGKAWLYQLREQPERLNRAFQGIAGTKPGVARKLLQEGDIQPQLHRKRPPGDVPTLSLLDQLSSQTLTRVLKESSPDLRAEVIRYMGNRDGGVDPQELSARQRPQEAKSTTPRQHG